MKYISDQVEEAKILMDSFPLEVRARIVASQMHHLKDYKVVNTSFARINNFYDRTIKGSTLLTLLQPYLESPKKIKLKNDVVDEFYSIVKSQLNHRYILGGMEELSARLSPMVYAGQDYSNKMGNEVLKMVTAVNAQVSKQIKARDNEFDDEDEETIVETPVVKRNKMK